MTAAAKPGGFKHIGTLTLRPEASAADRSAIADGLSRLVGAVEGLLSMEVYQDAGLQEGNASLTFVATFTGEAAWRAYRDHPAHLAVVRELIAPVLAAKAFVQAYAPDGDRAPA